MDTVYILDVDDDCTKRQLAQALILGQKVQRINNGFYSTWNGRTTSLTRGYFYKTYCDVYPGIRYNPIDTLKGN